MKEHRQIVSMWRQGRASVLTTLVRTKGSSYRRPGARLLLGTEKQYAGTISGGCLEAEVVRKAAWLTQRGAVVEQYSTEYDDTGEIPFGLGCGGVVDLLLEPAGTPEFEALMLAMERSIAGQQSSVLTWLPRNGSLLARAIYSVDGTCLFRSRHLAEEALGDVSAFLWAPAFVPEEMFVEQLFPPQKVFVLGAGDDVKPLVSMGNLLGWTMIVRDGRSQLARPDRFPDAEAVSVIQNPVNELSDIGSRDAVVLMTHSYEQDKDLLAAVLPLRPGYLGLLGARHRTSLLISEVADQLGYSIAECCERIHSPVGLNLGGDGPEAIALAVTAEIQAARTGKLEASRKLSPQDVETYLMQGNAAQYLQTRCAL